MSKTSRRSLLGTASIAAASAVAPSIAKACPTGAQSAPASDPIFAAIERFTAAQLAADLAADGPEDDAGDEIFSAANEREAHLRMELAGTSPTTPAGLAAYASFLHEEQRKLRTSFFEDDRELPIFFAALHRSAAALAGNPPPPDGDHRDEVEVGAVSVA